MGSSRLIPYVVNYVTNGPVSLTPGEYQPKYCGKPGAAGLAKHVEDLNKSFEPGGVNHYPSTHNIKVVKATLINQKNGGTVVATWQA